MTEQLKDVPKSGHGRLLKLAKETKRPFGELLQLYAMERFLYRLYESEHAKTFVLKGGLMLRVWNAPITRPTKDVDLLGRTRNSIDNLVRITRDICAVPTTDDGMRFDAETTAGSLIKEDAEYSGVRVKFIGYLGKARASMQLDVGLGDSTVPAPVEVEVPALLNFPAPKLCLMCSNDGWASFARAASCNLLRRRCRSSFRRSKDSWAPSFVAHRRLATGDPRGPGGPDAQDSLGGAMSGGCATAHLRLKASAAPHPGVREGGRPGGRPIDHWMSDGSDNPKSPSCSGRLTGRGPWPCWSTTGRRTGGGSLNKVPLVDHWSTTAARGRAARTSRQSAYLPPSAWPVEVAGRLVDHRSEPSLPLPSS